MSHNHDEPLAAQARNSLVNASLFLTAYQLLRNAIVDRVRDAFLRQGWDYERYDEQVLTRHKSRFNASLLWLVEVGALQTGQVDEIHEIRRYRNKIAYDLENLLRSSAIAVEGTVLERIRLYLDLLDQFFLRYQAERGGASGDRTPHDSVVLVDHIRAIVAGQETH